jgi:ketosteroid isomerase-like protein
MSQENLDLVRSIYAEWERGDFGGTINRLDEHVVYTTFAAGEGDALTFHGRDAMISFQREFFSNWRKYRVEGHEFRDVGEMVLVEGHQYAEGKESGVSIDMPLYAVWTFQDGRVIGLLLTRHRQEALEAVGLSE